ncbi:hypothetical protein HYV21_01545 [Candidatus Microgenomates bacterium]|nr:hypothetical protein [Candidatus Microgenomates bacterium]
MESIENGNKNSEVKTVRQHAEEFIRSLPKDGVFLHLTTFKNSQVIQQEGAKSTRGKIWQFSFASHYPFVDYYSSKGIRDTIRKFRGSIVEGLNMTEHHREGGENVTNLSPDSLPVLVIGRKQRSVDSTMIDTEGDFRNFPTGVSRSISPKDILYISTISPEEYRDLVEKSMNEPLPKKYAVFRSPRERYILEKIAGALARKAIIGLMNQKSEYPNTVRTKLSNFFAKLFTS